MRIITSHSSSYTTTTPEKTRPAAGETRIEIEVEQPTNAHERPEVPILRIEQVQKHFQQQLGDRAPRLIRRDGLKSISRICDKDLNRAIKSVRAEIPAHELPRSDVLVRCAEAFVMNGNVGDYKRDELSHDIDYLVACMQAAVADHPGDSPDAQQQRRCLLIDFFGRVFRNEFRSDAGRWGANLVNVGLRTGLVVATCTFMRDAVAFEVSKATALHGQDTSLYIASILAIAIGPTLNLLGGILSGIYGTANLTSVTSRVLLGLMNLGVILACHEMGSLDVLGTVLPAFVCYNAARDACNFFFPLRDNLTSLPVRGVFASGTIYSLFQWLGGMTLGVAAPHSGASGLPRAFGNETVPRELVAAARLNIAESMIHARGNAILEILDDQIIGLIVRFIERREYSLKSERNVEDETAHKEYIDELTNFAKRLLETPAEDRQNLIDEKNVQLYEKEWRRMTNLPEKQLDPPHKQYLENIESELRMHAKKRALEEMWDREPPIFTAGEMHVIWKLEHELGVYKKTRDLERMSRNVGILDKEQTQALKTLQDEVFQNYQELLSLRQEEKDEFDEELQNRLEYLEYEFDDKTHLTPARLPPMSVLGISSHDRPLDFSNFDERIRKTCRKLHSHVAREDRQKLVEELFVYEFVRAYLPFPTLTPVEREVLESIAEKAPKILPSELLSTWEIELNEKRRKDAEGLRIGLGVVDIGPRLVESIGQKIQVTGAARQTVFANVVGAMIALSFLLKDSDDDTQLVLGNLMVGIITFLVYPCLYLIHMEGAAAGRPVERPGAQGRLPPLREEDPERMEAVVTPRGREQAEEDDRNLSEPVSSSEISVSNRTFSGSRDSDDLIQMVRTPAPRTPPQDTWSQ